MASLIEGIYFGSLKAASQRAMDSGIARVISIQRKNAKNALDCPSATVLLLMVDDTNTADLISYFPEAINFIDEGLSTSGERSVLVHCHAGLSRSPTIVIAYLMKARKCSFEIALSRVKKVSSRLVNPNPNFRRQLRIWEEMCWSLDASNHKLRVVLLNSYCAAGPKENLQMFFERRKVIEENYCDSDKCFCSKCGKVLFSKLHIVDDSKKKVTFIEPQDPAVMQDGCKCSAQILHKAKYRGKLSLLKVCKSAYCSGIDLLAE
jgi:predicted protein tyrosine phosphatase